MRGDSAWIEATALEDRVFGVLPQVLSVVLAADRNRDGLVAVVVTPETFVSSWCQWQASQGAAVAFDIADLRARQSRCPRGSQAAADVVPRELEDEILASLRSVALKQGLRPFEVPVACVVELSPWTAQVGPDGSGPLLTLTALILLLIFVAVVPRVNGLSTTKNSGRFPDISWDLYTPCEQNG